MALSGLKICSSCSILCTLILLVIIQVVSTGKGKKKMNDEFTNLGGLTEGGSETNPKDIFEKVDGYNQHLQDFLTKNNPQRRIWNINIIKLKKLNINILNFLSNSKRFKTFYENFNDTLKECKYEEDNESIKVFSERN
uniref:Plasmodium RESA N-terminal domain-containing protein n=1 Tax=Meloidogyne hapla TaxID=6305 RepID=A0A1I8C1E7_MELHA